MHMHRGENNCIENKKIFSSDKWKTAGIVIILLVLFESFLEYSTLDLNGISHFVLGYVGFQNRGVFFASVIKFMLPQLGALLIWGNYFEENILKNSSIIFTRTKKASKIVWKYTKELITGVLLTMVLFEVGICCIYYLKGYRSENLYSLLLDLVIYAIYMITVLVITNVLSFVCRNMYGVCIVLFLQLVALEYLYPIYKEGERICYGVPTAAILLVHNAEVNYKCKLAWCGYLAVIMFFSILVGTVIVKRKEIYIEGD